MDPYSHWGNLRVIRYRSMKVISFSTLNSIDLITQPLIINTLRKKAIKNNMSFLPKKYS